METTEKHQSARIGVADQRDHAPTRWLSLRTVPTGVAGFGQVVHREAKDVP